MNTARQLKNYGSFDPIYTNSYLRSENTKCKLSIDRIKISIVNKYDLKTEKRKREKLFSEFNSKYYKIKDTWISDENINPYGRIKTITSKRTGKGLSILYHAKKRFYPPFQIVIDDPDKSIIDSICKLLKTFSIEYSLSYIELAFDFTPYNYYFQQFLRDYLYLNYYRNETCSFANEEVASYYLGKRSKNLKSIILYPKKIKDQECLRLELRLNSQVIKRLNIELPSINLDQIDFRKIVNLKCLNRKKLKNYFRRKFKNQNHFTKKQIESRVRVRSGIQKFKGPVTDIKYNIKNSRFHHHNYTKLFEPVETTNDLFHKYLDNAQGSWSWSKK